MPLNTTLYSETVTSDGAVCAHVQMKQGDAGYVPVEIQVNDELIGGDAHLIRRIEYALGKCLVKEIRAEDAWDAGMGMWLLPFDQGDTILMRPGVYDFDLRVYFTNGGVLGARQRKKVHLLDANSMEVIGP